MQVPRLQKMVRDRRANWDQSIAMLRAAKQAGAQVTKTSIMLGCGEHQDEVLEAMQLLRHAGTLDPLLVMHRTPAPVYCGSLDAVVPYQN